MESSISYFYQDYFCPTCNGYHDYSPCQTFEFDNRDARAFSKQDSDTEVWKISRTNPSHVEWSHVPTYEVPLPIIEFYPSVGIVQPELYDSQKVLPLYQQQQQQQQQQPVQLLQNNQENVMMKNQIKGINNQGEYNLEEEQEKTLQIRVASLNKGKLVWITIEPRETGASIAQKIHSIAGFQTRNVISISTASGRQLMLNKKTFVFDSWNHINQFKHGEIWKVEWEPVKRNLFEKVLYKIIKV